MDLLFNLFEHLGILFEEGSRGFTTLADPLVLVAVPCTGPLDDIQFGGYIKDTAYRVDTLCVDDVEFGDAERRCNFVFDHFHFDTVAVFFAVFLQGLYASDIETNRGVELEGVTTGGGLRVAVHDTNFLTKLVDEDNCGVGLAHHGG